jgi:hypothetical protein
MSQMQQFGSRSGVSLDQVAHTIARIAAAPQPKLRYPIGGQTRVAPLLKHLLPQRWFESLVIRQFGASPS